MYRSCIPPLISRAVDRARDALRWLLALHMRMRAVLANHVIKKYTRIFNPLYGYCRKKGISDFPKSWDFKISTEISQDFTVECKRFTDPSGEADLNSSFFLTHQLDSSMPSMKNVCVPGFTALSEVIIILHRTVLKINFISAFFHSTSFL